MGRFLERKREGIFEQGTDLTIALSQETTINIHLLIFDLFGKVVMGAAVFFYTRDSNALTLISVTHADEEPTLPKGSEICHFAVEYWHSGIYENP